MRHLMFIAGLLAVLGACSSGSCDSGGGDKNAPAAEPKSLPGSGSHGGTGESVSFQGLGRKTAGDPATPPGAAAKAESALGGSGSNAPAGGTAGASESVICGGFPYLTADCTADPVYQQVLKKCCPTGQVDRCQAIPGGARLTGRGCTAPAAAPAK